MGRRISGRWAENRNHSKTGSHVLPDPSRLKNTGQPTQTNFGKSQRLCYSQAFWSNSWRLNSCEAAFMNARNFFQHIFPFNQLNTIGLGCQVFRISQNKKGLIF
jgi:hypothetical protein